MGRLLGALGFTHESTWERQPPPRWKIIVAEIEGIVAIILGSGAVVVCGWATFLVTQLPSKTVIDWIGIAFLGVMECLLLWALLLLVTFMVRLERARVRQR